MIKILFIFKLIHTNIIYITPNSINNIMGFNSFINNYLRYQNININI